MPRRAQSPTRRSTRTRNPPGRLRSPPRDDVPAVAERAPKVPVHVLMGDNHDVAEDPSVEEEPVVATAVEERARHASDNYSKVELYDR